MSFAKHLFYCGFLGLLAEPAAAEVPLGLWKSTPDRTGVVVHVRTKPCGPAFCGQIERAKDRRGYDTPSRAVGQRILLDMLPEADGTYLGKLVDSQSSRVLTARMKIEGNKMRLQRCDAVACEDVIWTRLR